MAYPFLREIGDSSSPGYAALISGCHQLSGIAPLIAQQDSNLNLKAIKPAVAEIDAMALFGVKVFPIKEGRKVVSVRIGWWHKEVDELKTAFAEVSRSRVGRKARIKDQVEETVQLGLPTIPVKMRPDVNKH